MKKPLKIVAIIVLLVFLAPWEKKTTRVGPKQETQPQNISAETQKTPEKSIVFEDIVFPKHFFFGTASSDFQTTGGNGLTDWNEFVKTFKSPLVGPGVGTDFLKHYKDDLDLAAKFHNQVHRLSLEWARIEPEESKWNREAIKKYKEIFLYMSSRGIEPMICLNHFALPLWFAEKGGWENPRAAYYYSRYAEKVAREIGLPLKIKWWLTFNEPQVMMLAYTKGNWPPYKSIKNFQDASGMERALLVASHLLDAHRLSYRAIHSVMDRNDHKVMVSFASAPGPLYPYDPKSPLDNLITNTSTLLHTLAFDYAIGTSDRDFLGINYYGRAILKLHISLAYKVLPWLNEEKPFAVEWEMPDQRSQGDRPREFYPKALYDLIMKFKNFELPIVITENGISDAEDKFREEFIVIHLKAVHDTIRDGSNVIGYQYWALTDTWEWEGKFTNFGLIAIDRNNNLGRKLRPSAFVYGEIIKTHKITKKLLEKHRELLEE